MDWAPVVPAAITGVVGIAGVAGTLLSVGITTKAETQRLREAEKRRVYAAYNDAIQRIDATTAANDRATEKGISRINDTMTALSSALSDMFLIAPAHVQTPAIELYTIMLGYGYRIQEYPDADEPAGWNDKHAVLIGAMRADLGETS